MEINRSILVKTRCKQPPAPEIKSKYLGTAQRVSNTNSTSNASASKDDYEYVFKDYYEYVDTKTGKNDSKVGDASKTKKSTTAAGAKGGKASTPGPGKKNPKLFTAKQAMKARFFNNQVFLGYISGPQFHLLVG